MTSQTNSSRIRNSINSKRIRAPHIIFLIICVAFLVRQFYGARGLDRLISSSALATSSSSFSGYVQGQDQEPSGQDIIYMKLPKPNLTLAPLSFGACCGIGHRLSRNIPTIIYGISQRRLIYANWKDISWNIIFNNTDNVIGSKTRMREHYPNSFPGMWKNSSMTQHKKGVMPSGETTSYTYFSGNMKDLFDMPLAQSVIKSLRDALSPLVLSFLTPIREQMYNSDLTLCVHVREGNNETGDWVRKKWRHIDFAKTLNATLSTMNEFVLEKSSTTKFGKPHLNVSIFVASDNLNARTWFEENANHNWTVIKPGKELPRPENGVWFGEHGSSTNKVLSAEQKNQAMAEAVSDVFALGECDALFIPNYSSFSFIGVILARARKKSVFFMSSKHHYIEFPYPSKAQSFL